MKEVVVGPNICPWDEESAGVEEEERFEDEEENFEDEEERFEDEEEKFEDDEEEKFEDEEEDEVEEDSSVEVEARVIRLEGEGVELSEQPLPALCKGREAVRGLVQQQQDDASLRVFRKKGKEQTNGYVYADGVLVHVKVADPGREWTRVVVPTPRRREVLDVAHRGLAGGHFSHKRMVRSLRQYFTWPGMRMNARSFCSSCPECQKAGMSLQPKVHMVETPVINVPYQRLACDLVGPLPRTSAGHRYILTVMCLGTRYPYCVSIKRVDDITISKGLMEVIAHTGIPLELFSDQGAVFTGRFNQELCRLLNISMLRTTAYHPQTNGALERWHGCLKGMLRRLEDGREEWDRLLKYCLLAYRTTPYTATGFSPFELVHGRALRGPLEAMKEGWVKSELSFSNSFQWVNDFREKLTKLHEVARANEAKYKAPMKQAYDEKAVGREFKPGEMVLLHTPCLSEKLDSIWEGPYEVEKFISATSYKLSVPDKMSHTIVVHINRLKPWNTPTANLFRVVVAEEREIHRSLW